MSHVNSVQIIFQRMKGNGSLPALYWKGQTYTYDQFLEQVDRWSERLKKDGVGQGTVCGLYGDYSLPAAALIFALIRTKAIFVPFTRAIEREMAGLREIAGVQCMYRFTSGLDFTFESYGAVPQNDLIVEFLKAERPGLVVFSSGSTGKPKGILQDCERVMKKFVTPRKSWRTVLFLMMDHFGGFNTFLSSFAYGGMAVCIEDRTPDKVCRAIQDAKANLLPTSPTFINLLLATTGYKQYDLSSIELISYGTEVMPTSTLEKLREAFPKAQIKQTYGLSELGVLRSKSEGDASVWVKIGGDGFEVKVVDNILWVRSESNMVGYLNAPQPFDSEGWMCTGDEVEVKGEYMRIKGRKSEMINVGGQKVFPAEVETVLLRAPNVHEVTVYGSPHPLMGQVVVARVSLIESESFSELTSRLRKHCLEYLTKYKVPVKFIVVDADDQRSERFKKFRKIDDSGGETHANS